MKKTKDIVLIIFGLLGVYIIASLVWSILNMQTCSPDPLPENASCEQIVENDVKNCRYTILKWKKIDYDKEIKDCREWEQRQETN